MNKIECLKDCEAWCCRDKGIVFDLSDAELEMMFAAGGFLLSEDSWAGYGGYVMLKDCPFLKENKCTLHGTSQKPQCCQDVVPGDSWCMAMRNKHGYGKMGHGTED